MLLRSRLFALALACCATLSAQSLRDLAAERGLRFGAAVNPARLTEAAYADTLGREFNQAEPENAMKWAAIHPGISTYDYSQADTIAAFARAHAMALRGHTLIWHQSNPAWLTNGNYSAAQLAAILEDHITTVVRRYAGQVYAWDVVNEAFNDNGTLRSTIWSDAPGIGKPGAGYMEQSFRWARAADPAALLFYNDYSAETINAKSDAIFKMVQDFRARGVPIDGVGLQMHFTTSSPSLSGIEANIRRLTELGLQVHITEFDVRLPVDSSGTAAPAALAAQAQIYGNVVALCLKFPLCSSVQTWGFTDKYSWIPGSFAGFGAGLPFDAAYRPKPAYDSMIAALLLSPPVIVPGGLVNAASNAADGVAPGAIAVLFGPTFGPASLAVAGLDSAGHLPTELAGARVFFDGIAAPLLYARTGQVGVVVPFELAGRSNAEMRYEYRGVASNAVTVSIKPAAPGIFTLDSSGQGAGAVLDAAYHVISKTTPAVRGEAVQIFSTGGGLATTATVTVGGVDCRVTYAGPAPSLPPGAFQVNAEISATVPAGEQAIVLTVSGVSSQPGVTIFVR